MSTRNKDINADTVGIRAPINSSPSLPSLSPVVRRFPPLVLLSCSDRRHSSRLGLLTGFSLSINASSRLGLLRRAAALLFSDFLSPIDASSRLKLLLACCEAAVLRLLVVDSRFLAAWASRVVVSCRVVAGWVLWEEDSQTLVRRYYPS